MGTGDPIESAAWEGRTIGRYQVIQRIAIGGMAEIFLAKERAVGGVSRQVVLKCILPAISLDTGFVELFHDEVRIAARLSHPNIAHVYDFGEDDGTYYIAMEYIDGAHVSQLIRGLYPDLLPIAHAVRIAAMVTEALDHAHNHTDDDGTPLGIIHRDVSPENVMVSSDGQVKLVDFGVARATDQIHETAVGVLRGKAAYLSPEQCRAEPFDHRVDIFSLGIVLHEMLCGKRLFKREGDLRTMKAVCSGPIPKPSKIRPVVGKKLDAIVMRALARDPLDRYQRAGEMGEALEEVMVKDRLQSNQVLLGRFVRFVVSQPAAAEEGEEASPAEDDSNRSVSGLHKRFDEPDLGAPTTVPRGMGDPTTVPRGMSEPTTVPRGAPEPFREPRSTSETTAPGRGRKGMADELLSDLEEALVGLSTTTDATLDDSKDDEWSSSTGSVEIEVENDVLVRDSLLNAFPEMLEEQDDTIVQEWEPPPELATQKKAQPVKVVEPVQLGEVSDSELKGDVPRPTKLSTKSHLVRHRKQVASSGPDLVVDSMVPVPPDGVPQAPAAGGVPSLYDMADDDDDAETGVWAPDGLPARNPASLPPVGADDGADTTTDSSWAAKAAALNEDEPSADEPAQSSGDSRLLLGVIVLALLVAAALVVLAALWDRTGIGETADATALVQDGAAAGADAGTAAPTPAPVPIDAVPAPPPRDAGNPEPAGGQGTLVLAARSQDSVVLGKAYVSGADARKGVPLPAGTHQVRVIRPRHRPWVETFTIEAGESTKLRPEPLRAGIRWGRFSVESTVPADVHVAGVFLGRTPLVDTVLWPGPHEVTLQALDGRHAIRRISIRRGRTRSIRVTSRFFRKGPVTKRPRKRRIPATLKMSRAVARARTQFENGDPQGCVESLGEAGTACGVVSLLAHCTERAGRQEEACKVARKNRRTCRAAGRYYRSKCRSR